MELQEYHEIPSGAAESAPEEQPLQPLPEREVPQQEVDYRSSHELAEPVPATETQTDVESEPAEQVEEQIQEGPIRKLHNYARLLQELGDKTDMETISSVLSSWESGKTAEPQSYLDQEQQSSVMQVVDSAVQMGDYAEKYIMELEEELSRASNSIWQTNLDRMKEAVSRGDKDEIQALLRESVICVSHTNWLHDDTREELERQGIRLVPSFGLTNATLYHQVLLAFPQTPQAEALQGQLSHFLNNREVNAALSIDTMIHPATPPISGVTIIDPTFSQMCSLTNELYNLSPMEKILYLRSRVPQNMTASGVFVGPFIDYVSLITSIDPYHTGEVEFSFRGIK